MSDQLKEILQDFEHVEGILFLKKPLEDHPPRFLLTVVTKLLNITADQEADTKQLRLRVNQVEKWLEDKCMKVAEMKELLEYSAAYIKHPFTDRINSANLLEKIEKAIQPLILCGPCGKVVQDGDPGHEKSGYSYCEKCAPTEEEKEDG